jgi:integrase
MAAKLAKTSTPGIYRRHERDCNRQGRCECSYVVVWRHRGKQHTDTYRTMAEAREAQGQRHAGARRPSSKRPFPEYAQSWLDGYQGRTARGFDDGTRESYRRALEQHAIPFFAGFRLCDIEQPDVRRFVTSMQARGLAAGSVRKYVTPLKAMFATAVEDGDLAYNPSSRVRISDQRDREQAAEPAKAMTRAELEALLGQFENRWRLEFELLAHTGLRVSELLGLDWSDVQFGERPTLTVRRQCYRGTVKPLKSRAGRRDLPLSPAMARKLWAARPARAGGPMFATASGRRIGDRNLRRVLDRASSRAGIPWIGFHTFRHTCASILLDSGKNIRQVSAWLGHEDPAFTLRVYTHLMDAGLGDADVLDNAVRVNTGSTEGQETAANPEAFKANESAS